MSGKPYSFQGIKAIYLQPYDENVPYEFYFKITSVLGANDGAIPFGRTLKAPDKTFHMLLLLVQN